MLKNIHIALIIIILACNISLFTLTSDNEKSSKEVRHKSGNCTQNERVDDYRSTDFNTRISNRHKTNRNVLEMGKEFDNDKIMKSTSNVAFRNVFTNQESGIFIES